VGSWSFYELAIATKSVIAEGSAKSRSYRYRLPMVIDDLLGCIPEYERVEGFTAEKLASKRYIEAAAAEGRQKLMQPAAAGGK